MRQQQGVSQYVSIVYSNEQPIWSYVRRQLYQSSGTCPHTAAERSRATSVGLLQCHRQCARCCFRSSCTGDPLAIDWASSTEPSLPAPWFVLVDSSNWRVRLRCSLFVFRDNNTTWLFCHSSTKIVQLDTEFGDCLIPRRSCTVHYWAVCSPHCDSVYCTSLFSSWSWAHIWIVSLPLVRPVPVNRPVVHIVRTRVASSSDAHNEFDLNLAIKD